MNLADVIAGADPLTEPARAQVARLDGHEVLVICTLERTAVVRVKGDRELRLVRLDRLEVDPESLIWQQKTDLTQVQVWKLRARQRRRS